MKSKLNLIIFSFLILISMPDNIWGSEKKLKLDNNEIDLSIRFENDILQGEKIKLKDGTNNFQINLDGDFIFDIAYTAWRPPKKVNNSANPVHFKKTDFKYVSSEKSKNGQVETLDIFLHGTNNHFDVKLTYTLEHNKNYFRRRLSIRDTVENTHFLRKIHARKGEISQGYEVIKKGSYGQPAALKYGDRGVFFGLEFPTSTNTIKNGEINSYQHIGQKITNNWISSENMVFALYPDDKVKHHFYEYLGDIRVDSLEPYTLYNSWYDLRSKIYTDRLSDKLKKHGFKPEDVVMNEKNVNDIKESIHKNFTEKHDIKLDAFVLDDGWDIYESPWKLREKAFPHGMKPIANDLAKDNTDLGIWFGPTGGYSYRMKRINWMDKHGYETVGEEVSYNSAMLCLAGDKYSDLFKKRVKDFVKEDNVGFFKWDGIQFVCNEPDHGHPVGIYSREAVLDSLIDMCNTVRKYNPDTYLNITSGTWLSPWWVKYANQIWMGGGDYGWAPTPSLSKRDGAITYRDNVLYSDLVKKDFWFPISNLMTHGIIKGKLQLLGGTKEPLDKFTDNALLYFARGVSMYELYISPNILSEGEWNALSQSIKWAKDRFKTLQETYMIGGNPLKGESYGYAHYSDKKGIIALRNPFITKKKVKINLSEKMGLASNANNLVLERIYPTRLVSSQLYSTGENVEIELNGYETAIYEVYPKEDAQIPLVSGLVFGEDKKDNLEIYKKTDDVKILNPGQVEDIKIRENTIPLSEIDEYEFPVEQKGLEENIEINNHQKSKSIIAESNLDIPDNTVSRKLAVLVQPDSNFAGKPSPEVEIELNGKEAETDIQGKDGAWHWYKASLNKGKNEAEIAIKPNNKEFWTGTLSVYVINEIKHDPIKINFNMDRKTEEKPMPPSPWQKGVTKKIHELEKQQIKLGE